MALMALTSFTWSEIHGLRYIIITLEINNTLVWELAALAWIFTILYNLSDSGAGGERHLWNKVHTGVL